MSPIARVRDPIRLPRLRARWIAGNGLAVWMIVLALLVVLTARDPERFWSSASIANVVTGMVVLGLVSLGQHVVMLAGGIDLSVGSVATLSGLVTAVLINGYPIRTAPVILAMLAGGAIIGIGHGLLVAKAAIAPFVVTLATFYIFQGLAFMISTTPEGQVTTDLSLLGLQRVGPVPYSALVLVIATLVVAGILYLTAFGRHIFAAGGDSAAAYASGVSVARTLAGAYAVSGALAAAAGVMLTARATIGSPTAGQGLELSAITAVVIGGTSLLGGRGRLVGTLGGITLLALLESSFAILQLPATLNDLVRGVVILAAASLFIGGKEE